MMMIEGLSRLRHAIAEKKSRLHNFVQNLHRKKSESQNNGFSAKTEFVEFKIKT